MTNTRCGYVALVGRPNVGKSTLTNRLIGEKLSITSSHPQTTRHAILGIHTQDNAQIIYVDTPGLHKRHRHQLDRYLNRAAEGALSFAHMALVIFDAVYWTEEDDQLLQRLKDFAGPSVAIINKMDRLTDKSAVLPLIKKLHSQRQWHAIIPLSALHDRHFTTLEKTIVEQLPASEFYYAADQITVMGERFIAAERIREQLMRSLHDELPYAVNVQIEQYETKGETVHITAIIWVERASQKGIVIGAKGAVLKKAGTQARQSLENYLGCRVFLRTWVKVREGWSDDQRALQAFGFQDQ